MWSTTVGPDVLAGRPSCPQAGSRLLCFRAVGISLFAGLTQVSEEVIEAARIDGTGCTQILWRTQAFMRAARNVGYALGALLAGMALALESDLAMELVPLLTRPSRRTRWVW